MTKNAIRKQNHTKQTHNPEKTILLKKKQY